ncbi:olfactory receptor 1019-like [Myripristis murdjan]|uniref:olfactory receptor 1019-like n=1 Tax=Myripristis murdjan TaxID=586833 RepID=UPI0011761C63|nr:olfactory receptor 1019-like [Myripristis murdjan]
MCYVLVEEQEGQIPTGRLTLLWYCIILFVNVSVIITIITDENLHEPMCILLCNFCISGLYGTTGFSPKFLSDLLSSSHVISYAGCLFQAFVVYSFALSDISILAAVAYNRYLAICRPLQYHSVMTKKRLCELLFSWIMPLFIFSINILLTSRLKLCGSNIQRLMCINWMIVKLACSNTGTASNSVIAYLSVCIYLCHCVFITWSYVYLMKTCVQSKEDRTKFMQTCVPHLISLVTFLVTIVFHFMHMQFGSKDLPQILQDFIAIEFLLIAPVMNPLIYGFKLTKLSRWPFRFDQILG